MAHAALRPADSEALRSHEQLTFHLPPYTYQISRQEDGSLYSVTDGKQDDFGACGLGVWSG